MNDFIALFMMIIVYFLPYFLIFKLIKLSAGALGKIQGAVDGAGKWAADRGAVKSLKENARKSAQTNRQSKANRAGSEADRILKDPNASKFSRARALGRRSIARSTLGTAGATGEYSKVLRDKEEKAMLENAQSVLQDTIKSNDMDFGKSKRLTEAIAWARDGEEIDLAKIARRDSTGAIMRDASGNILYDSIGQGKLRVSDSLQQQTASYAASQKMINTIDILQGKAAAGDVQAGAVLERAKNSNFSAFDAIAPDVARGQDLLSDDIRALATARYDQLKGSQWSGTIESSYIERDPAGKIIMDPTTGKPVVRVAKSTSFTASDISGVSSRQQAVAKQLSQDIEVSDATRQQALIELNKYASSPHTETDARAIQHLASTLAESGKIDAETVLSVVSSAGNQKFVYDSGADRVIAVDASSTGSTGTAPAPKIASAPPTATALTADGTFYTSHPQPYLPNPTYDSSLPISDTNQPNIPNPAAEWKETK